MSLKCQGKANNFFVQIHFQHAVIYSGSGGEWCVTGALLAAVVIPLHNRLAQVTRTQIMIRTPISVYVH
jgi:hypothetical protein